MLKRGLSTSRWAPKIYASIVREKRRIVFVEIVRRLVKEKKKIEYLGRIIG